MLLSVVLVYLVIVCVYAREAEWKDTNLFVCVCEFVEE